MGILRIEKIYAVVMLVSWATAAEKSFIENKVNFAVGLMVIAMTVSAVMSPYSSIMNNQDYYNWMKWALIYALIMTLIKSERDLKIILAAMIISFFFYMAHSYREFLCGKGSWQQGVWKIVGIDGADANTFGASCNYMLPFLIPFILLLNPEKKWQYFFIPAYFLLTARIIQLTGSRSSFLTMIFLLCLGSVLSKHRLKFIPLLLLGAVIGWNTLNEQQKERYRTIWDPNAGAGHTQSYSAGRLSGFWGGLEVFMTSPIYGVGPGCYRFTPTAISNSGGGSIARGDRQSGYYTHFLYGEIPAEEGLLGILGWSSMLFCVFLNHLQIWKLHDELKKRKLEKEGRFVMSLSTAIMYSFALLLFFGFAGHNALRANWLWYPAFQGVGLYVLQQKMMAIKKAESTQKHRGY